MQIGNQQFFAYPKKGPLPPHSNTCEKTGGPGHQHRHIALTLEVLSVLQTSKEAALTIASFKDEAAA